MGHTLITGGSSGIGLAIAVMLARRGDCVSIVARDEKRLDAAMSLLATAASGRESNISSASADVGDGQRLTEAVRHLETLQGPVDTVVASAGIVHPELFGEQSADDFDAQMRTNLTGAVNTVRAVYPGMCGEGRGRIMIVASGAALVGIPGYAGYCASKFALDGFASSLRLEARPHGVAVSVAFPPDTSTPQFEQEIALRPMEARRFMGQARPWPVEVVADQIIRGMDAGRNEVHFGVALSLLAYLNPLVKPVLEQVYLRRSGKRRAASRPDHS